ncbi:MAG: isoleucine--tRNA ligase [candidate division Zixibacteria bacterium HGW-Zixibacteria-1]|nr:MAG: isoleucine--tRNA ligase [candidate division Zixibacteria bacterium HGW-Zixibacteria-1]
MKFDQLNEFKIPDAEAKILKFWEDNKVFEKSMEAVQDRPHFVFYEGPPTANGKPGIHHVLSRTIKDMVCRYKSMKGFRVDRKGGWDTHGLPVEIEVQKRLGFENKSDIFKYGIDKFTQQCKESVFKYIDDWNTLTRKMGYWLDLDNAYITLADNYVETVWWILKNYFDRDLIYKGYKTVPFCPSCETGLSSHEVAQGYAEVADPSVFVKVKAVDEDYYFLVWTTTPWTLPSNAALCMHPNANYVLVNYKGEKLVLAEALAPSTLHDEYEVLERKRGSNFANKKYIPLFDTFKDMSDKAFYVINGDFVTLEDGTGIVHIAPGYGADDYEIGQKYGLPVLQAVAPNGHFVPGSGKYEGKFIKKADPFIIEDLKTEGKLFKVAEYVHNYPFCWRCDSPLIYITRHSWYIRTTQFKEQLLKNSNAIHWYPDEIRTGRMLEWLENNVDWALSRERFWGTPLPIWICDNESCGHMTAVGSLEQIRRDGIDVPDTIDVHKPGIDAIKLKCEKCGGAMTRVPEVIDTWFDSGSMPYAQWHYPFENKDVFEIKYPCEFISEAIDQTRGWFYTLLAISTMLFDKEPFRNVLVHSHVLDKEGKKMSKSKGNVVDPLYIFSQYGADPLRWLFINGSNPWLAKKFDEKQLDEVIRKFFDTLKNSFSFFALYSNIDDIAERANKESNSVSEFLGQFAGPPERIDQWIISRYNTLVKNVGERLDNYDITPPTRQITDFVIDDLSNWYIRLNRRRFWAPENDPSKMRAYLTLYEILCGVARLIAPAAPFMSEFLWQELTAPNKKDGRISVHMQDYPDFDEGVINSELEESMALAQKIVSIGRAARNRVNIKVRQPLAGVLVNIPGIGKFDKVKTEFRIIKDELNVKEIEDLSDISSVVSYKGKLNFAKAGPRLGSAVKQIATRVTGLASDDLEKFIKTESLEITIDGTSYQLTKEEVDIEKLEKEGFAVESDDGITVALKTEIDDILRDEGFAREIVNKIQNMRKSSGFEVTDRIKIMVRTEEPLAAAVRKHDAFICGETLADEIALVDSISSENGGKNWNINGIKADIVVIRI